jgi:plastocyanin
MGAAVPGTLRAHRLTSLAVMLAGAALVAAACAPAGSPANVPISTAGLVLATQVVDEVYDVGRSPSVGLDQNGDPSVAYLLLQPVLAKGAIPPPVVANTPQPPSVVLAFENGGIWTRRGVTQNKQPGNNPGTAKELADSKGHYLPGATVAMAVDAKGLHHVVWSTPTGLFYAADQAVSSGGKTVQVFPDKPTTITADATSGASIAVTSDGTPWIAYLQGSDVKVATLQGTSWSTQTVGKALVCADCPSLRTAIAVGPDGEAWVAFDGPNELDLASRSTAGGGATAPSPSPVGASGPGQESGGTPWSTEPVPGVSQAYGLSIALAGPNQQPVLAFYGSDGAVTVEARRAAASWQSPTSPLGTGGTRPTAQQPGAWTTGVGVDNAGDVIVSWADLSAGTIMAGKGSLSNMTFTEAPVQQSADGWSPSVALSPDGKHLAIAWYDSLNKHLNVAVPIGSIAGLAVPSPSFSPLPTAAAPGVPPCLPTAGQTTLSVTAKNIAFDTNCLAAPPDTAFSISFDNQDAGTPHNVEIYSDSSATKRLGGATGPTDTIVGVSSTSYKVDPLPAGIYFFKCDVHPQMNGTFVVAKPKP